MITLDFILDNLNYDVLFDDGHRISGDITYVTQHLADGVVMANVISSSQMPEIAKYLEAYNKYNLFYGPIDIVKYYDIWSKENEK